MDTTLLDAKITAYKEKIKKLDVLAEKMPSIDKKKYWSVRTRYEQRLNAWRHVLGSDLAVFDNNVAEGYHELESYVVGARDKEIV